MSIYLLAAAACADSEPKDRVAELFPEPASAKFQGIVERGDYVCGEVNGKNDGRYTGYRRFVYDRQTKRALMDPGVAPGNADSLAPNAACRRPLAYQTVEERLSCAEAPRSRLEASRQSDFDASWHRACARN